MKLASNITESGELLHNHCATMASVGTQCPSGCYWCLQDLPMDNTIDVFPPLSRMNSCYFANQFKMSSDKTVGHMQYERRRWGVIRVKDLTGIRGMEKRKLEYDKDLYENSQAWELFTNIIC